MSKDKKTVFIIERLSNIRLWLLQVQAMPTRRYNYPQQD